MGARRRDLLGGLGVGAGLMLGGSWASSRAGAKSPPRAPAPAKALTLGALFPTTGPLAALGDECLRGVQLAVELCNEGGGLFGRQLTLAVADAPDPDRAVAAARKLIADMQPAMIFGSGDSALSLGASEVSEGSGVPYWELTATMPAVTTRGFHYLLRVCDIETGIADRCFEAAAAVVAPARQRSAAALSVVLLYADDGTGSALVPLATAAAQKRGMKPPLTIAYQPGVASFSAIAARLATMRPDVVIHHGSVDEVVLFFESLSGQRWRPGALIGATAAYGSAETAAMIGPAFDGTLAVGVVPYGVAPQLAPEAAMIALLYEQRFGAQPRSGLSLSHFAGAALGLDVLRQAGTADKDKVMGVARSMALAQGGLANGWGALFGAGGQNLRAFCCLSQWQGGEAVALLPAAGAAGHYRAPAG
ncbi:MAG: ABC transporter substrate-binding protein [Proteobacteria bacterium]|nr:ABC transporter substrate-binding protein [Pseudomonadota bacterium]